MALTDYFGSKVESSFDILKQYQKYVIDVCAKDDDGNYKSRLGKVYERIDPRKRHELILGPTEPGERRSPESELSFQNPLGNELWLFLQWVARRHSGIDGSTVVVEQLSSPHSTRQQPKMTLDADLFGYESKRIEGFVSVLSIGSTSRSGGPLIIVTFDQEKLIRHIVGDPQFRKFKRDGNRDGGVMKEFKSSKNGAHFGIYRSLFTKIVLHEIAHVIMHIKSWDVEQRPVFDSQERSTVWSDKDEEKEAWSCSLLWWTSMMGEMAYDYRESPTQQGDVRGMDHTWRMA